MSRLAGRDITEKFARRQTAEFSAHDGCWGGHPWQGGAEEG